MFKFKYIVILSTILSVVYEGEGMAIRPALADPSARATPPIQRRVPPPPQAPERVARPPRPVARQPVNVASAPQRRPIVQQTPPARIPRKVEPINVRRIARLPVQQVQPPVRRIVPPIVTPPAPLRGSSNTPKYVVSLAKLHLPPEINEAFRQQARKQGESPINNDDLLTIDTNDVLERFVGMLAFYQEDRFPGITKRTVAILKSPGILQLTPTPNAIPQRNAVPERIIARRVAPQSNVAPKRAVRLPVMQPRPPVRVSPPPAQRPPVRATPPRQPQLRRR